MSIGVEPSSASTDESTDDDVLKKGAWTAEEDAQLFKLVQVCSASCYHILNSHEDIVSPQEQLTSVTLICCLCQISIFCIFDQNCIQSNLITPCSIKLLNLYKELDCSAHIGAGAEELGTDCWTDQRTNREKLQAAMVQPIGPLTEKSRLLPMGGCSHHHSSQGMSLS